MKMNNNYRELIEKLIEREIENLRWEVENGFIDEYQAEHTVNEEELLTTILNNAINTVDYLISLDKQTSDEYEKLNTLKELKQVLLIEYAKLSREKKFLRQNFKHVKFFDSEILVANLD